MRALARGLAVGLFLAIVAFLADGPTNARIFDGVGFKRADGAPPPLVLPLAAFIDPSTFLALLAGVACARLGTARTVQRSFLGALVVSLVRGSVTAAIIVAGGLATVARFSEQPEEIFRNVSINFGCGLGVAAVLLALVETLAARRPPSLRRDAVALALMLVIAPIALWLAILQILYARDMIEHGSISASFAQVPANARQWLTNSRFTVWFLSQGSLVLAAVPAARLRLERPLPRMIASCLAGCAIVVLLGGFAANRELGILQVFAAVPAVQITVLLTLAGAAVAELVDAAIGARVAARFDPPAAGPDAPEIPQPSDPEEPLSSSGTA
jgi:hypothetical protein